MSKSLWVTWESHRRSKELAAEFEADYYPLVYEAKRPLRYFVLSVRTVFLLIKTRPKLVFCQNPSIVLTTLLVFLKSVFRYKLIVDRHSNFKLEYKESSSLKWRVFHFLSKYTIRNADLTLVTNNSLKSICSDFGGRAEVLQDKIPKLTGKEKRSPPQFMRKLEKKQIMFVTMFDADEPIDEIVAAGKELSECVCYLTGNYRKCYSDKIASDYVNYDIIFTGFVSEEDYLSLMENSDLVVVLTKKDLILNCGGYEAISMKKPLVLSDTPTLRDYFGSAAVYSKCSSDDIRFNILDANDNLDIMLKQLIARKGELEDLWIKKFTLLKKRIENFANE